MRSRWAPDMIRAGLVIALSYGGCDGCSFRSCSSYELTRGCSSSSGTSGCNTETPGAIGSSCGASGQVCCTTAPTGWDSGVAAGPGYCAVGIPCVGGVCVAPPRSCGGLSQGCCSGSQCDPGLSCRRSGAAVLCVVCGVEGQTCCEAGASCGEALVCVDSECQRCGGTGERCCGERCRGGRTCVEGVCPSCGMADQPCCASNVCNANLRCAAAVGGMRCLALPDDPEPCFPGTPCGDGGVCQRDSRCAPAASFCGIRGGACCAGRACGPSLRCVDRSEVTPRDAATDVADAAEAEAGDAGIHSDDVEDAGVDAADATEERDAAVDAADADPGVCVSCGGFNEPCCAFDECLPNLSCGRRDAGVCGFSDGG